MSYEKETYDVTEAYACSTRARSHTLLFQFVPTLTLDLSYMCQKTCDVLKVLKKDLCSMEKRSMVSVKEAD